MIRYMLAVIFMAPLAAMAFEPLPLPNCPVTNSSSTDGDAVSAMKCRFRYVMSMAYNRTEGKFPESVSECAGTFDEVFDHRITQGVKHDGRVMACTQAALNLGVLPPIY